MKHGVRPTALLTATTFACLPGIVELATPVCRYPKHIFCSTGLVCEQPATCFCRIDKGLAAKQSSAAASCRSPGVLHHQLEPVQHPGNDSQQPRVVFDLDLHEGELFVRFVVKGDLSRHAVLPFGLRLQIDRSLEMSSRSLQSVAIRAAQRQRSAGFRCALKRWALPWPVQNML